MEKSDQVVAQQQQQHEDSKDGTVEAATPTTTPRRLVLHGLIILIFAITLIFPNYHSSPIWSQSWHRITSSLPPTIQRPFSSLHKRATTSNTHPTIAITSSFPALSKSSPFYKPIQSALSSLSDLSKDLTTANVPYTINGIPGTGITTLKEAKELQKDLDDFMSQGEWKYDEDGSERIKRGNGLTVHKQEGLYGSCDKTFYKHSPSLSQEDSASSKWNVRSSLKYIWTPSRPPPIPFSRTSLCQLLAHKSLLLLGDKSQFLLHDLILDWTTMKPQTCYGDLYCKEHRICGEIIDDGLEIDGGLAGKENRERVEDWKGDERVFDTLPPPPAGVSHDKRAVIPLPREKVIPAVTEEEPLLPRQVVKTKSRSSPTLSTLLRYRRTDGLRVSSSSSSPEFIHPSTGIREVNQQWLADSRRSDLVLLNKAPLPLSVAFEEKWIEWKKEDTMSNGDKVKNLIKEVEKVIGEVWLPELLQTLKAIRASPSPRDQLVIYRSSWRTQSECAISSDPSSASTFPSWDSPGDGPPPMDSQPDFDRILFSGKYANNERGRGITDVHSLYYNLQEIFQNHLLRSLILPSFGIPYLDLESLSSPLRTGLVGSSLTSTFSSSPFTDQSSPKHPHTNVGLRSAQSGDCTRYCLPSPGGFLEETVLGGLGMVMERGWRKGDRGKVWVGEGFESLKERIQREKDKEKEKSKEKEEEEST